jgi:hypothetical protein
MAGKEAKLHQTPGDVVRQFQAIQNARLALRELSERTSN